MTDCVLALSRTKLVWMISSYGDQSTTRNNPSYYYRASPTLPQLLWMLYQRHLMFYTCNYNIRVTHRNGAIKHIFLRIRSTEDHQRVFFIHLSLIACSSSAVKYCFKSFCMKDLSTLTLHTSVSCISSRYQQDRTVTQPILLSENIPNIWHKSSTKHKGGQTRLKR